MNKITKSDLKSGYIFLNYYEGPTRKKGDTRSDFRIYFDQAIGLICDIYNKRKIDLSKYMDLVHFLITKFDNDHYFHAALYLADKGVCEATTTGVKNRSLVDGATWVTDAFEFSDDQGIALGQPELPIDPIDDTVQRVLDSNIPYGYNTALLMMAICVLRRWRALDGTDVEILRVLLRAVGLGKEADDLPLEKIANGLRIALEMIVVANWTDDQMMCSQFVSYAFNANKDERYHLTFVDRPMGDLLSSSKGHDDVDIDSLRDALNALGEHMQANPMQQTDSYNNVLEDALKDAFTPGDIKASGNTKNVGRLDGVG